MHTVNRDHDPPFLIRLQLNPNSGKKVWQIGRKKQHTKTLDPFPLCNYITKLVNAEKTCKEILFIPQATISSKLTPKKIRGPDWSIA